MEEGGGCCFLLCSLHANLTHIHLHSDTKSDPTGRTVRDAVARRAEKKKSTAVLRTRLRLDRAALAASLAKRGLIASPLCPLHPQCRMQRSEQTVEHALLHCPSIAAARARCRNQLRAVGVQGMDLSIVLGRVAAVRGATIPAAAAAPAANASSITSIPQAVYFPGQGASRPPVPPASTRRQCDELATARKIL